MALASPARRPSAARFLVGALALSSPAAAQGAFATQVVDYSPGPNAQVGVAANALGGPEGGGLAIGSFDVVSLGTGGSLTLGFDVTPTDGPGADLIVFENGFATFGGVFAEAVFVEVSSDGVAFARFPSAYAGPAGPLPAFGSVALGSYAGLAGGLPVLANVASNGLDPFDPVAAGGDAFDLAELADHPLVTAGTVDLAAISCVRLVDVEAGVDTDSGGTPIWDNGGPVGAADVDAVAVLNHVGNQTATRPALDLYVDGSGYLHVVLGDPDGLADLDFAGIATTLSLTPTAFVPSGQGPLVAPWKAPLASVERASFFALLNAFTVVVASGTELHLRTTAPVVGSGLFGVLTMTARDRRGEQRSDQVVLQG